MNNHYTTIRIPVDDEYAAALGKAIYVFAYYESTVLHILDILQPGYLNKYNRPKKPKYILTSGKVSKDFQDEVLKNKESLTELRADLDNCQKTFDAISVRRNELVHGHPMTLDGKQILGYQTTAQLPKRPISDMIWQLSDINGLIMDINNAAIEAYENLTKLKAIS